MKIIKISILATALFLASLPTHAAPTQLAAKVKKGAAVKHAEAILGKPLNATQLKAVRAAQKKRAASIKPIQEKFKAEVAKALGLTVAQLEAREKAIRVKKDAQKPQ